MNTIIWGGVAILSAPFTAGGSIFLGSALTGLAIVSTGFSIASAALEESDPGLAKTFGWVAFGTGVAGAFIAPVDSLRKGIPGAVSELSSVSRLAAVRASNVVRTNVTRMRNQLGHMQDVVDGGLLRMKPVVSRVDPTPSYLIRGKSLRPDLITKTQNVFKQAVSEWTIADSVASVAGGLSIAATLMAESDIDPTVSESPRRTLALLRALQPSVLIHTLQY